MHGRLQLDSVVWCFALLVFAGWSNPARAEPRDDDDPPAHRLDRLDEVELREHASPPMLGARSPLWVTLSGKLASRDDARQTYGAMVMLGLPLDRMAAPRRPAPPAPASRAAKAAQEGEDPLGDPGTLLEPEPPAMRPPPKVLLAPTDARRAVRAALLERGLISADARVDGLESRATASALLPELRLRVTRLVDEDERLSPTEYDPNRTMASGGTSLWMEARATWKLDRLVFADEEVALARLRLAQRRERQRVVADVLALLLAWQSAVAHASDEHVDPDRRWKATLEAEGAALSLDVETGGWFSRWLDAADALDAPREEADVRP